MHIKQIIISFRSDQWPLKKDVLRNIAKSVVRSIEESNYNNKIPASFLKQKLFPYENKLKAMYGKTALKLINSSINALENAEMAIYIICELNNTKVLFRVLSIQDDTYIILKTIDTTHILN